MLHEAGFSGGNGSQEGDHDRCEHSEVGQVRGRLGLTEEQFAQRVGVTYGSVNHWENGKRRAPPFLVGRLVEMREEVVANTIPLKRNSAG